MRGLPSRGGSGLAEKRGGVVRAAVLAASSRRGRGCWVPGAEHGRHWSTGEGKDPAQTGPGED